MLPPQSPFPNRPTQWPDGPGGPGGRMTDLRVLRRQLVRQARTLQTTVNALAGARERVRFSIFISSLLVFHFENPPQNSIPQSSKTV